MRRRHVLALSALAPGLASAQPAVGGLLTRAIASTAERVPAVGLGAWLTFDVPLGNASAISRRREVVERFFAGGGRWIDSSPMYGQAEALLGEVLSRSGARLFSATKVWTPIGP